jgi:type IV secretory pathway VirB2 component (pilin)
MVVIVEKNQQSTMQGDNAAKIIASVIIAGIMLMFGYGLLHWIFFE